MQEWTSCALFTHIPFCICSPCTNSISSTSSNLPLSLHFAFAKCLSSVYPTVVLKISYLFLCNTPDTVLQNHEQHHLTVPLSLPLSHTHTYIVTGRVGLASSWHRLFTEAGHDFIVTKLFYHFVFPSPPANPSILNPPACFFIL